MLKLIGILKEESDEMDKNTLELLVFDMELSTDALLSLVNCVQALEDYGYELDEEWDKLLKSIEQIKQGKSVQKKEEAKNHRVLNNTPHHSGGLSHSWRVCVAHQISYFSTRTQDLNH